jgi:heme/copper-type cytochrome/quinol oxidase subunit 4
MLAVCIIIAIILAIVRICGHKSQAFQAVAHLFVGACFSWWLCTWTVAGVGLDDRIRGGVIFCVAAALSAIELACFLFLPKSRKET